MKYQSVETLATHANPVFSLSKISQQSGGIHVNDHGWNRATIAVCGQSIKDERESRSGKPLPCSGGETAVDGTRKAGQPLSREENQYSQRTPVESAPASCGADRAEHERLDGSRDRRHGGASCGSADYVRTGIIQRDNRSHEHRDIPQSIGQGRRGGNQQGGGEGSERRGIHGERVVFVGYHGAGSPDRVPDGSRAHAQHRGQALWNRETDSQEIRAQTGETVGCGAKDVYDDTLVCAWQEARGDRAEEKTVEGIATDGITHATFGGRESLRLKWHGAREVSGDVGVLPVDAQANTALDAHGISSAWQVFEFVGEDGTRDHAEQIRQDDGVRAALVYHEIKEGLHHRGCVQEVGERFGHGIGARDFGTLRENDGGITEGVCLRSWRRRAEESQDIAGEENHERDISQGQGVVGRIGTEHGSQGPPGTRVIRGVDRDDQKFPLWIQQAPRKKFGGVRVEGAFCDIGSEFDAVDERLGDGRSGGIEMETVSERRKEKRMEQIPRAL